MNTFINTMNTAYKNTSILFFAFLLFFFTHSPLNAATLIFNDGFESGNLDKHSPQLATVPSASFTVIKTTVASGSYAGRLYLPFVSVSADNYRSETVMQNGASNFDFNKEYWFSFKFRYEDWVKDSSAEMAPFQIHLRPSSWDSACATGAAWSNAPFYMWAGSDYMAFNTYKGVNRWKAPIQKNKWLTITVRYIPSYSSNGVIEAWFNGSKIVSVSGANQAQYDKCGLPFKPPYLKIGTYKWDWKAGHPATQSTQRTLLIDDLKIAAGADGYNTVTSSSTTTTTPTTTQDTTPPAISNVQAAVTDTTATITWNTNEASNSVVNYGLTTSYGANVSNSLAVTSHSVTLQNLTSNSLHHYKVSSKDSSGNTGSGTDLTFTTTRAAGEELVAYWPMDPGTGTNLPDLSGNGHTGTLVNGALLTTSGGVRFDGSNDYANVGKFDIAGKAMSISAWVWSDSLSNCSTYRDCRIISKATSIDEQDHYFMVSPIKVGTATRLRFRLKANGVTSTLIAASGNLVNKTWFHVAAVYDGQTMRLYKDGVEVGSMAKSGSLTTNSNAYVWIGSNPANGARPWKGQIDDVSLYSYALTKEEIAELAQ